MLYFEPGGKLAETYPTGLSINPDDPIEWNIHDTRGDSMNPRPMEDLEDILLTTPVATPQHSSPHGTTTNGGDDPHQRHSCHSPGISIYASSNPQYSELSIYIFLFVLGEASF